MTTLEIHLNGTKQCVAGITDGTVDAHFFCACARSEHKNPPTGDLGFVWGLDSRRHEHLEWIERELAVGDELVLRIVKSTEPDTPEKRTPSDGGQAAKEKMVRRMVGALGWTLTEA